MVALCLLCLLMAAAPPEEAPTARAIERVVRSYDERDGLTVAEVAALAQDSRGFIWIGTIGGLTRFDGTEMRRWAPELVRHVIQVLATGPHGEVVVAGATEPLWHVTDGGVEAIRGPHGGEIRDWVQAAISDDGALWVVTADTLHRRAPDLTWSSWVAADFDSAAATCVFRAGGDSVFVATRRAVWTAVPHGAPRPLATIAGARLVDRLPDGTPVVATYRPGGVWRVEPAGPRLLYPGIGGVSGLAIRGETIWATVDVNIVALPPDGPARIVAPLPGLPTGRPLLVDREGTLWIGGFRGLMALPEPETVSWNELDGLPTPAHAHHLCRTPDAVWVITWGGTTRLDLTASPIRFEPMGGHSGRIRPDARGRLWAADLDRGFIRWDGTRPTRYPRPGVHGLYGTSSRPDGRLWLATDDGLFLTPREEGPPEPVAAAPPRGWSHGWTESWVGPVLEDRQGRLWLGHDEEIWCCSADSLARGESVSWRREVLPGTESVIDLVELSDGTIWLATINEGVLERRPEGWVALPGNASFESLRVYGMVPAPSGGVWVLAAGSLVRVVRRPDLPAGWEVVERLTSWQGLPTQQAGDIHEDPDGRLWLATLTGLVEVPPEARRVRPLPPPVVLVDVEVDGRPLPLDRTVRLPWRQNRLEIRFACLSYRDRNRLRYQVRTRGDEAWQELREPQLRFVDVAPGRYRAEVRASLDGTTWTDPPTRLDFEVGRPWWQEPGALALFAIAAVGTLFVVYRIRVGVLHRLERQRVRIAMDLHDEVGSGLGSIGILAGLAAEKSLEDGERRELAGRIAATAGELGGALGDIVGSLKQGTDSLESFGMRLAGRARRLVPGEKPRLRVDFPARWPLVRLSPETQRQVQAIASEALHNAVRHAGASGIELGLAPAETGWRLWVRDDGCGPDRAEPASGHGHGIGNMRTRARTIGAELEIRAAGGGGTLVTLVFNPGGGGESHDHASEEARDN